VFVVACPRNWTDPREVLFELGGVPRHSAPSREAGQGTTGTLAARTRGGGGLGTDFDCAGGVIPILEPGARTGASTTDPRAGIGIGEAGDPMLTLQSGKQHGVFASTGDGYWQEGAGTLRARTQESHEHLVASTGPISHRLNAGGMGRIDYETETLVTAFRTSGNCGAWDTGDRIDALTTGTDPNSHIIVFSCKDHGADAGELAPTLRSMGYDGSHPAVALAIRGRDGVPQIEMGDEVANAILTPNGGRGGIGCGAVMNGMAVRRLTPRECERLQGFPDEYTALPKAADGPRYKSLGNSMAVPVIRWIGLRIMQANRGQSHG
jgi:DNA (cytosine-5)-methyltransferase 1